MSFCLQWHVLNVERCPLASVQCPLALRQLRFGTLRSGKQPVLGAVF